MSLATVAAPITVPLASRTGETDTDTSITLPSLRTRSVSSCLIVSPRRSRALAGPTAVFHPHTASGEARGSYDSMYLKRYR